jgi:hypothetical protein
MSRTMFVYFLQKAYNLDKKYKRYKKHERYNKYKYKEQASSLVTGLRDGLVVTRHGPLSFWDGFALGRHSSFVPPPRVTLQCSLGCSAARHHAVWASALPSPTRDVAPIGRPVALPNPPGLERWSGPCTARPPRFKTCCRPSWSRLSGEEP